MRKNKKNRSLTIYEYIARRVPADAHFTINKFGKYRRARNTRELEGQLKNFVRTFGDNGLKEIAKIHPDSSLVEIESRNCKEHKDNFNSPPPPPPPPPKPETKIIYRNLLGDERDIQRQNTTQLIVFGGFLLMAVALIYKKK